MYTLNLNGEIYELRLTARGQKRLEDLFDTGTVSVLTDAIDKVRARAEVFSQALGFKGNQNRILDGYEFCDLLVDCGYAGPADFAKLLMGLGRASGIIDDRMEAEMNRRIDRYLSGALENGDGDGSEEEDGDVGGGARPTTAAGD